MVSESGTAGRAFHDAGPELEPCGLQGGRTSYRVAQKVRPLFASVAFTLRVYGCKSFMFSIYSSAVRGLLTSCFIFYPLIPRSFRY